MGTQMLRCFISKLWVMEACSRDFSGGNVYLKQAVVDSTP